MDAALSAPPYGPSRRARTKPACQCSRHTGGRNHDASTDGRVTGCVFLRWPWTHLKRNSGRSHEYIKPVSRTCAAVLRIAAHGPCSAKVGARTGWGPGKWRHQTGFDQRQPVSSSRSKERPDGTNGQRSDFSIQSNPRRAAGSPLWGMAHRCALVQSRLLGASHRSNPERRAHWPSIGTAEGSKRRATSRLIPRNSCLLKRPAHHTRNPHRRSAPNPAASIGRALASPSGRRLQSGFPEFEEDADARSR